VRRTSGTLLAAGLAAVSFACSRIPTAERVVLVTMDTTRADRLGCYGYNAAHTPRLDALAGESLLFEHAAAPVPVTLPSHASMLSGLYPQAHGIRYNVAYRLSAEVTSVAEIFEAAGFSTAAFPASFVLSPKTGLDQGFDTYDAPAEPTEPGDEPSERRAGEGVDLALKWLSEQPTGKLFLWLHFYDPHWPYDPPFPFSSQYRDRPYDGEIAYMDQEFGRFLDELSRRPGWDKTVLIVAGDHGEGLFDHRERYHSLLTYESTLRAPLLIRPPGGMRSRRSADPVSLTDIGPTLLEAAGLSVPGEMQGTSLVPFLRGEPEAPREIYFESLVGALNYGWSALKGIREGRWKFTDSSAPELYDLEADPGETNNLASLEGNRTSAMRISLREFESRTTRGATHASSTQAVDSETLAALASLGYAAGGAVGQTSMDGPHPRTLVDLEPEMMAAQGAAAKKKWPDLERTCRYVLGRDPHNRWALFYLATALMETGRASEGETVARELVSTYPEDEASYDLAGRVLMTLGRTADALATLEVGLRALPDSESLAFATALAAFAAGDSKVCSERVAKALKEHPESGRITALVARCLARDGKTALAMEALRDAMRLGFHDRDAIRGAPEFREVIRLPEFAEFR
jgi:arylsulfatase A-like enzyme